MIGIVRLALRRPYTFIVMAVLILIFGTASSLRTPTDIFPNINIPVISVVFSFTGLPADDMAGRVVTFYERSLPNSVNDIEHIESQSIANYGIIKIFFQPTVNINAALAQVNGMSQTVLKQMPPSITPPLILSFNASSVPILQLALSSDKMSETQIFDSALNFIRPALAPAPGPGRPQLAGVASVWRFGERRHQRALAAKPDHAGWNPEDRNLRIYRQPEWLAGSDRCLQQSSRENRQRHRRLYARRRLRA